MTGMPSTKLFRTSHPGRNRKNVGTHTSKRTSYSPPACRNRRGPEHPVATITTGTSPRTKLSKPLEVANITLRATEYQGSALLLEAPHPLPQVSSQPQGSGRNQESKGLTP